MAGGETRECGRLDLRIDDERGTVLVLVENINREGSHWLTLAAPGSPATPIGYIHLRQLSRNSHVFAIDEVRPAHGPLIDVPPGSSAHRVLSPEESE